MAKTILPEHVSNSLLKRMRIYVALKKLLSVPASFTAFNQPVFPAGLCSSQEYFMLPVRMPYFYFVCVQSPQVVNSGCNIEVYMICEAHGFCIYLFFLANHVIVYQMYSHGWRGITVVMPSRFDITVSIKLKSSLELLTISVPSDRKV